MIDETDTELIVLAGGKGSRLGSDKSRIVVDGLPILEHIARGCAWKGPTLLVKSQGQPELTGEGHFGRLVRDQYDAEGPLAGIVSALSVVSRPAVIILPIDMPFIRRTTLLTLLAGSRPDELTCFERRDQGGRTTIEPLPLAMGGNALSVVARQFAAGRRSLRSLLELPESRRIAAPPGESIWTNLNHPGDLLEATATLSKGDLRAETPKAPLS